MAAKFSQAEIENAVSLWQNHLVDKWQLDSDFAYKAAILIVNCIIYGLRPVVTSGYRSPERQAELVAAAASGNPNVHTPLPAGKSLHNATTWYGKPAALAMDMVTNAPERAGAIARYFGLVWGGASDTVHFALRRGTL